MAEAALIEKEDCGSDSRHELWGWRDESWKVYRGQDEKPALREVCVEVLVEEEDKRRQQGRVHVVDLALAHVRHLATNVGNYLSGLF